MSFFARCGVSLNNLGVFKKVCEKNGITYETLATPANERGYQVVARISGRRGHGLIVREGGGHRLVWDTDQRYNKLAGIYGAKGERLMRDYSVQLIKDTMAEQGGMVLDETVDEQGYVTLQMAVGG